MTFINSLKLLGSNWIKSLKFLLYYIVIWGFSALLLLPLYYEFNGALSECFQAINSTNSFAGVFSGALGLNIQSIVHNSATFISEIFTQNVGLAIYGTIILFMLLPFLINVGKYTFNEMLYSYMTSKTKVGFFSALVRSLKKSTIFAVCKMVYNMVFLAIVFGVIYGLCAVTNSIFVVYFLPLIALIVLVSLFTCFQLTILGWSPAMIVFDCNVFSAYKKGFKAVKRHFVSIFCTATVHFTLFWLFMMLFGLYAFIALIPAMTVLLCIFDMVVFYTSQGMRFYINENKILTPKKLEEVDKINKTAYIL